MIDANEIWQLEIDGQAYDAKFSELTQWITEGNLNRADKVRRGSLRWLEAGKIPALIPFFVAREVNAMPPPTVSITSQGAVATIDEVATDYSITRRNPNSNENKVEIERRAGAIATQTNLPSDGCCAIHEEKIAVYRCIKCGNAWCDECPLKYAQKAIICAVCGGSCELKEGSK